MLETVGSVDNSDGGYTPPVKASIESCGSTVGINGVAELDDDGNVKVDNNPLNQTTRSYFDASGESKANITTTPNRKQIIQNPLASVRTTNPFLFEKGLKRGSLPKVAQDIMKKSIKTNTFNS